jgi:hypothetical protein
MTVPSHLIYLLKTDLKTLDNLPLYKIGRSKQKNLARMKDYPKTYTLIYGRKCIDCIYVEKKILQLFIIKYNKYFKNEYFSGNETEMIYDIHMIINEESFKIVNKQTIIKNDITILNDNPIKIMHNPVVNNTNNKLNYIHNLGKLRSYKYYNKNKEVILQRRKDKRALISETKHKLTITNEPNPEKIVFDFSQHIVVDI